MSLPRNWRVRTPAKKGRRTIIICGLETSCDETALAVVEDGQVILENNIYSQDDIHRPYGGVVPEEACRTHFEKIFALVENLSAARGLNAIDAWAVTYGPGLVGALLIGTTTAKTLSYATGRPLLAINHLEGHLYSVLMTHPDIKPPWVGLVVSGGHTNLYHCPAFGQYQILGQTVDDAAGEAFDKVAKLLCLGYPGGPAIEKAALRGVRKKIKFTRPGIPKNCPTPFYFSFSGLKTAVLYYLRDNPRAAANPEDVAAGFQEVCLGSLVEKTMAASREKMVKTILISGGVSRNRRLRELFKERGEREGFDIFFPSPDLCTDNAAMIAGLAYHKYLNGEFAPLDLGPQPSLILG